MIYFDNAATGGKKPDSVIECAVNTMKYLSVNPGRGTHRLSILAEEKIYLARKSVCSYFNGYCPERVIFTKNCTEGLNVAIFGTLKRGGHVICSVFEHNSVLRPLYALKRRGVITLSIVKPANGNIILKEDIEREITDKTYLVCLTAISNVTGETNDYEAIGAFLQQKNILFLVDGAQGGGHVELNMQKHSIDILCLSGHKGLNCIQGIGVLIFNKNINIKPLTYGGSGSETFAPIPSCYPELLESGTHNLPAIIALTESVRYTFDGFKEKQRFLIMLSRYLIENMNKIKGIRLYSTPNPAGIVSFSYKDYFSQEISGVLCEKYGICTRGGFHCAPLTHEFLKTKENGLVRVSFSQYNDYDEIDRFLYCMQNVDQYLF